ncbi:MAG: hypothetical protein ACI9SC_001485 [Gammaproteobacteria bacterium]|jgi:hypothetical protein
MDVSFAPFISIISGMNGTDQNLSTTIGWREWLSLPALTIPAIKAKIDTGAKTSALHAFKLEPFMQDDEEHIRFWLHPVRHRDIELVCEAKVIDKRIVKDSGGHSENRYVINTSACLGNKTWPIDLTLTNREDMMFRMLLGRRALIDGDFIVKPEASYLLGKKQQHSYENVSNEANERSQLS